MRNDKSFRSRLCRTIDIRTEVMARDTADPLDSQSAICGNTLPLKNCGGRYPELARKFTCATNAINS